MELKTERLIIREASYEETKQIREQNSSMYLKNSAFSMSDTQLFQTMKRALLW